MWSFPRRIVVLWSMTCSVLWMANLGNVLAWPLAFPNKFCESSRSFRTSRRFLAAYANTTPRLAKAARFSARSLGFDCSYGRRTKWQVLSAMVKKATYRAKRLKRIRRTGVQVGKILRADLLPAVLCGAEVVGVPPNLLRRDRSAFHAVFSLKLRGRSAIASLALVLGQN